MSAVKKQVLLVGGALALSVLLFIAPKTKAHQEQPGEMDVAGMEVPDMKANAEIYLTMAVKSLSGSEADKHDTFMKTGKTDSLMSFWNSRKKPELAAYLFEQSLAESTDAAEWFKAGNRYYYSVQFSKDASARPVLYGSAMRCFDKAVQLDPAFTDARVMLASCYVEGGIAPMKGIAMMREIEKTDSMNLNLQLNFAFFSVRSGQMDKAIERFNKVLRIDSNYTEAYLHLADAYEQLNDKASTINMLTHYAKRSDDPTVVNEVNKYIRQLKASE
jgi:tetratricopeptide (TPR) repeat protein